MKKLWNWLTGKKEFEEAEGAISEPTDYSFKWHELGAENPFNKRILDIRSFTLNMVAASSNKSVAEKYNALRSSMGKEYIDQSPENAKTVKCNLVYPHNGAELDGVVFKAETMDCKWDIYGYGQHLYFTRSWTGQLIYKAHFDISPTELRIDTIEHTVDMEDTEAVNAVHFLMKSHAIGQPFPHLIPKTLTDEKKIAMWSFSQYGNKACYATYDDITDTIIETNE